MIKANELRIGNLVNVPREDQSPFRIDAFEYLSNTYIKVAMTHPEFGDKMHPLTWYDEDLKPIPLTEDWLLKFGFEKSNSNTEFYTFDLSKLSIHLKSKQYADGRTYFNSWCIIEKQIEYVHQLQNLYYCLTGSELTVA